MKCDSHTDQRPSHEYELLPSDGTHPARAMRTLRVGSRRKRFLLVTAFLLALSSIAFIALDIYAIRIPWYTRPSVRSVLTDLWPVGSTNTTDDWENENSKSMNAFFKCALEGNCGENQTSIVMLSSEHFENGLRGRSSGEDIWAMSLILALKEMGYTTIIAPGNYEMARTYRQYPDLVKVIIVEGSKADACFDDPTCIKGPDHPLGVPAWKMFAMHFWTGSAHPLGSIWTVSPEDFRLIAPHNSIDNFYLGYSIERTCMGIPVTPNHQRPMQAYIFAKTLSYFYRKDYSWPNVSWDPPFDVKLYVGMKNDTDFPSEIPKSITNLGVLSKNEFYDELGKSRAFIGIGEPVLSPSPYDALCMGVPFINPVYRWDKEDPENRHKWGAQHEGLRYEDPPYVYHVRKGDEKGLWAAVRQALDNPIERYIPATMTMEALKNRVGLLVEGDWRSKAEELLDERIRTGGRVFEI
ncbi:hypothetical protein HGRIS_006897 [Hohenbuehelia grisea]|uniref:alpha-1,6-mannosyl-glycoprotein 6-beta-N-acetylglucosaminyltransferase n=1 Tax=Hohenbuehelia grisea TaxID=104357 RepID=A0ABR3JAF3_9AGAR